MNNGINKFPGEREVLRNGIHISHVSMPAWRERLAVAPLNLPASAYSRVSMDAWRVIARRQSAEWQRSRCARYRYVYFFINCETARRADFIRSWTKRLQLSRLCTLFWNRLGVGTRFSKARYWRKIIIRASVDGSNEDWAVKRLYSEKIDYTYLRSIDERFFHLFPLINHA